MWNFVTLSDQAERSTKLVCYCVTGQCVHRQSPMFYPVSSLRFVLLFIGKSSPKISIKTQEHQLVCYLQKPIHKKTHAPKCHEAGYSICITAGTCSIAARLGSCIL